VKGIVVQEFWHKLWILKRFLWLGEPWSLFVEGPSCFRRNGPKVIHRICMKQTPS
jgi:hypothetical protein